jgi:ABC-type nickel/cobalt efflux system permease component RcnA
VSFDNRLSAIEPGAAAWRPPVARLALALGAVAALAFAIALLFWLLAPEAPPAPVKNPFGTGLREAAPAPSGFGARVLAIQASFFAGLQAAVSAVTQDGRALWSLVTVGFAYGVFHAAGPGHGKAVIAAFIVSSERALLRGVALSVAAALIQALVAIALVGALFGLLGGAAAAMGRAVNAVEVAAFLLVALIGAATVWRKAGSLLALTSSEPQLQQGPACACDAHLIATARPATFRAMAMVALGAGLRPCAGAIVVLTFALSRGVFPAGIAATLAMAAGTALTTATLASLAVFAKRAALGLASRGGRRATLGLASLELAAAAFVCVFGLALLLGLWTSEGAL